MIDIQSKLTAATSQLLEEQERNDELSKAIFSLEDENSHLSNDIDKLNQNLSSLDVELARSRSEVQRLQQTETNQNETITKHVIASKQQEKELREAEEELQRARSKVTDLESEVANAKTNISELRAALHSQEDENKSVSRQLCEANDELDTSRRQLIMVEQREKDAVSLANRSQEETTRVMKEMTNKLEESCANIRSELAHTHKIELDSMSSDLKRLTEENCKMRSELNSVSKSSNEMSKQLKKSLVDLEEEKRQHDLLKVQALDVSWKFCVFRDF